MVELSADERMKKSFARLGQLAGVFRRLPLETALRVFDPKAASVGDDLWIRCLESGRGDVGQTDSHRFNKVVHELADGPLTIAGRSSSEDWLGELAWLLHSDNLLLSPRYRPQRGKRQESAKTHEIESDVDLSSLLSLCSILSDSRPGDWRAMSAQRHRNFHAIRDELGPSWTTWRAAFGVVIEFGAQEAASASEFLDTTVPEIARLDYAYQNRTNLSYWSETASIFQSTESGSFGDRMAIAAAALAWATSACLSAVVPSMANWWNQFSPRDCSELRGFISMLDQFRPGTIKRESLELSPAVLADMRTADGRLDVFLATRLRSADRKRLLVDLAEAHDCCSSDGFLNGEILGGQVGLMIRRPDSALLKEIADRFVRSSSMGFMLRSPQERSGIGTSFMEKFPTVTARQILHEPLVYPWQLVDFANQALMARAARSVTPLRATANRFGWFHHDADGTAS